MDVFSAAMVLIILAAVLGSAVMVAAFGWLFVRMRRLEAGDPGGRDLHHLLERMDDLREQFLNVQDELSQLNERVDFTERLLEPGGEPPGIGPSAGTREPPDNERSDDGEAESESIANGRTSSFWP